MRITTLILTLIVIGFLTASAQDSSQKTATTKLSGCLKGSDDQYYLVEKNGDRHTLMAKNEELRPYVNHMVTVTGKEDTSRVAPGASSDIDGHRSGFVSVNTVNDQGPCKQ